MIEQRGGSTDSDNFSLNCCKEHALRYVTGLEREANYFKRERISFVIKLILKFVVYNSDVKIQVRR